MEGRFEGGRPEGGYYAGGDRGVLARHFSQISGAGIGTSFVRSESNIECTIVAESFDHADFIVIDATNLQVRFSINCSDLRLTRDAGLWQLPSRLTHGALGRTPRRSD